MEVRMLFHTDEEQRILRNYLHTLRSSMIRLTAILVGIVSHEHLTSLSLIICSQQYIALLPIFIVRAVMPAQYSYNMATLVHGFLLIPWYMLFAFTVRKFAENLASMVWTR